MLSTTPATLNVATLTDDQLDDAPLAADQVISGDPQVRHLAIAEDDAVAVGIWQHSVGVSTDTEADEIFVVISGRATVTIDDGSTLELSPGVVGRLTAGARTTWTVHETLRKVYVLRAED